MQRKHVYRGTRRSAEEVARHDKIREQFQRKRPTLEQLVKSGEYTRPIKQGEYFQLLGLAAQFKAARQAQKLSLADVARLSGIDRAAISRIENGVATNPTILTLARLARSVGMQLRFELENSIPAKS